MNHEADLPQHEHQMYTTLQSTLTGFFANRNIDAQRFEAVRRAYESLCGTEESRFDSFSKYPTALLTQLIEAVMIYETESLPRSIAGNIRKGLAYPGKAFRQTTGKLDHDLSQMRAARRFNARKSRVDGTPDRFKAEFKQGLIAACATEEEAKSQAQRYCNDVPDITDWQSPEIIGRIAITSKVDEYKLTWMGLQRDLIFSVGKSSPDPKGYPVQQHLIKSVKNALERVLIQVKPTLKRFDDYNIRMFHVDYGVEYVDGSQPYEGNSWQLSAVLALIYFVLVDHHHRGIPYNSHPIFVPWIGTGEVTGQDYLKIGEAGHLYEKVCALMFNDSVRKVIFSESLSKQFEEEIIWFSQFKSRKLLFINHEKYFKYNYKYFYASDSIDSMARILIQQFKEDRRFEQEATRRVMVEFRLDESLYNVDVIIRFETETLHFPPDNHVPRTIKTIRGKKQIPITWHSRSPITIHIDIKNSVVLEFSYKNDRISVRTMPHP